MSEPLKPCGTYAAYRRHLRNDEPMDELCAQAGRDQKNKRADGARELSAVNVSLAIAAEPPVEFESELDEALENLRIVKAAMHEAPANTIAALSKRREELVSHVARLRAASKPEMSALDQLAQRRAERLARTTG